MSNDSVVLRFSDVTFWYGETKPILSTASFSVRNGSRVALMGQNGAGKSSIFKLILGDLKPSEGSIFLTPKDISVGIARQVVAPSEADRTVRDFFAAAFVEVPRNLDRHITKVLDAVNLTTDLAKQVREHSGGQQARLLLAYSLMCDPDILLLDEPTNNLDQAGIDHLTGFLMTYDKTAIVISHDADFLNAFTDGVLYLDVHTHTVEQYSGTYLDVVAEIARRIERERAQNARTEAEMKRKKEQAEVFAHKGGKLRLVAKKMREAAEEAASAQVEVRQEDRTIRGFSFPTQKFDSDFNGKVLEIRHVSGWHAGESRRKDVNLTLHRGTHLLISGPNGIGKSAFLRELVGGTASGVTLGRDVRLSYYPQDFSTLDYTQTAFDCLRKGMEKEDEHLLRSTAAGFLLDGKVLGNLIGDLSEGQKGLLLFARIVLQKPGLLIMDEPTNHINFRHLPVIARALSDFEGAMVLVSHIPDFVASVRIDEIIDLEEL